MEDVLELSDVVIFELPEFADVDAFAKQVQRRWPGAVLRDGDVWRVTAAFGQDGDDLAPLLRAVERYVAEAGLQAIRYSVDDRFYILQAAPLSDAEAA